jgi:DNA topoisomerase IB
VAKTVAEHLGNTPAVARSAYIDPRVVEAFQAEDTLTDLEQVEELEEVEAEVIKLVRRADRKQATG